MVPLLNNTSAPFAKKLLAQVRAATQQVQNGQMGQATQGLENIDLSQLGNDPNSLEMVQKLYNENIATVPVRRPNVESPHLS